MKAPCTGCPHRHIGCHAECRHYQTFSAEREKVYTERRNAIAANDVLAIGAEKKKRRHRKK